MSHRITAFLTIVALTLAAFLALPALAGAQNLPEYPGPFDGSDEPVETDDVSTDADDAVGDTTEETGEDTAGDTAPDEVLGQTVTASVTDEVSATAVAQGDELAVTGSDVEPIVAVSAGLLALGGAALVGSRRRLRDFFA